MIAKTRAVDPELVPGPGDVLNGRSRDDPRSREFIRKCGNVGSGSAHDLEHHGAGKSIRLDEDRVFQDILRKAGVEIGGFHRETEEQAPPPPPPPPPNTTCALKHSFAAAGTIPLPRHLCQSVDSPSPASDWGPT